MYLIGIFCRVIMIKLRKINNESFLVKEAKQVGTLYHICTLDAVADYIAPRDTLSASGQYKNFLLKRNDVVSFTRDKSFVVKSNRVIGSFMTFQFAVDGDKLSERYKIVPYNDFAYDIKTGKLIDDSEEDEWDIHQNIVHREREEVVIGSIHPFSKYIKSVSFGLAPLGSLNSRSVIQNLQKIVEHLNKSYTYLSKFNPTYNDKVFTGGTYVGLNTLDDAKIFLNNLYALFTGNYSKEKLEFVLDHISSKDMETLFYRLRFNWSIDRDYLPVFYSKGLSLNVLYNLYKDNPNTKERIFLAESIIKGLYNIISVADKNKMIDALIDWPFLERYIPVTSKFFEYQSDITKRKGLDLCNRLIKYGIMTRGEIQDLLFRISKK